jgi:serine/threonine-protein kinase
MKRYSTLFLAFALFITACSKKNDAGSKPVGPIIFTPTVTTFAGSGAQGLLDGTKEQASFNFPTGITITTAGFLFVADKQNNAIRIISPQGIVNTIAGTGTAGFSNAKNAVTFNFPSGVAADFAGNVYVADQENSAIRAINITGVTTTFAGKGFQGFVNGRDTSARFNAPTGIAVGPGGNIYVADNGNNVIRKITPGGTVTTFAGTGVRGATNGTAATATFNQPQAVAVDSSGNVYVADQGNNLIRKITSQGVVSTFAGNGTAGNTNATGTAASFNGPAGIAVDANGNVYIGDSKNNLIRKITKDGVVSTLTGTGAAGKVNGALNVAVFNGPQGVAVDGIGRVFVADTGNGLIRMITQ